jgi:DNA invertase Pin-like site-specific DNA recombinase
MLRINTWTRGAVGKGMTLTSAREGAEERNPVPDKPRAFSYRRFSTPEQAQGHSLQRQTDAAEAWCAAHNVELDRELKFEDLGVSAFRGRNVEVGALGAFIRAVEDGRVPQGSYLLVESLDRISRDQVLAAQALFSQIILAGITLVTLTDNKVYSKDNVNANPIDLIVAILTMIRAHEESAMKGVRVRKAYDNKRKVAREQPDGKPFTRMLPAWLRVNETTRQIEVVKDRAELVKWMFEQARNGRGMHGIAKELNGRGVPTWGMRGRKPAYYWQHAYIAKILRNTAVLGTFTPHVSEVVNGKRKRRALDPVLNYFPAIVDAETFQAVQARLATVQARGRHANTGPAHLFAGLLRCPHCGGTVTRVKKPDAAYLICAKANSKGACERLPVRSAEVESAFLQQLPAVLEGAPRGADTAGLEAEAEALAREVEAYETDELDLVEELMDAPPASRAALREKLAKVSQQKQQVQKALRDALERRDAMSPAYVQARLEALQQALQARRDVDIAGGNKALRAALTRIDLDALRGKMHLHYHHAPDDPQEVRFPSKFVFQAVGKDK